MYCSSCGTQLPDNAQFCHNCGNKTVSESISSVTATEHNVPVASTKETKKYLACAKRLETHRHTIIETYNQLQDRINRLGHYNSFQKPTSSASSDFGFAFKISFVVILIVGIIICIFTCNADSWDGWLANIISIVTVIMIFFNEELLIGIGITLACAVGGGFVFGILAFMSGNKKYHKALKNYNKAIENDKKRVEREKQQIVFLKKQQAELQTKFNEVEKVMENFYALNVIYPKYRSLIPIVTFYEYFESGRHTNLVDAYNKYEDELLHKTIIEKLDVVISQLEQIKRNQAALYEVIVEANSIAERICQQSDALIASNKIIEQNTALAAYNAKIAADNSTINAYINVCRL